MKSRTSFCVTIAAISLAAITLSLAVRAQAQTETVLYGFTGGADGANPIGGLISDATGNLYGTTFSGGNLSGCGGAGCGVVFKLSPSSGGWTETVLHTFSGGADGANPGSALIFGADGNLYGTASSGGVSVCHGSGCGLVFQLSPKSGGWSEKVLHAFSGSDGFAPYYQLVADAPGNLYGTTLTGGNLVNCASHTYGCGVAFKLTRVNAGWSFHELYNFTDSDSSAPASPLIFGPGGILYGSGVAGSGGVVYRLTPTGGGTWKDTVVYSFGGINGNYPQGLVYAGNLNVYGVTYQGGTGGSLQLCQNLQPGCGTMFQLSLTNPATEAVLHNFNGFDANPNGSLLFINGSLYGVDSSDAFKLSPLGVTGRWKKTVLHTFGSAGDGSGPRAPLLVDSPGNFFGVTYQGGASGKGTIFEITP